MRLLAELSNNALSELNEYVLKIRNLISASVRKTYLGFAVSLALYEGRIKNIDDYVTNYLDDVNEHILKDTKIRHLLTHTHGLHGSDYPKKEFFPQELTGSITMQVLVCSLKLFKR